jgi:NADH-quinone oxidoreductase subunit N
MSASDLTTLIPLIILGASPVALMLVITFYRSHILTFVLTVASLALCLVSLTSPLSAATAHTSIFLTVDEFAIFFMGLIFSTALVTSILAFNYLKIWPCIREEFYMLLLIATLGCSILVCSNHFATFFLGLELLSVSLYALIAYPRGTLNQIEAGIKYLILAASAAAFLLFGMALIYFHYGTMEISGVIKLVLSNTGFNNAIVLTGFGLLIVGIGFKLAVVPFHFWTPDVYEGAPAPVTGFIATASKGAIFAVLLRFFTPLELNNLKFYLVFTCIAVASMFVGNLLALLQNNIKRILAYSSIAHLGYLLVALLVSGPLAVEAGTFYLLAYFITTLGAFGVLTILSNNQKEPDTLDACRGLASEHPWLAAVFTVMVLSLAGIPLTAGFVGKFYLLWAGVNAYLWLLVIILVVNSAIGLFYYLRIIVALYSAPDEQSYSSAAPLSFISSFALTVLTLMLIWIGVYPAGFLSLVQRIASMSHF